MRFPPQPNILKNMRARYLVPPLLLVLLVAFQNCGGGRTPKGKETSSASSSNNLPLLCPDAFCATYYDDIDKSGNYFERMDAYPLDFDWGNDSPDPQIDADTFSASWLGSFNFPVAGNYEFSATADDGVQVIVDGKTIIDAFVDQGPTLYTAVVPLSAGYHRIEIEYYENGGGALFKFSWAIQ